MGKLKLEPQASILGRASTAMAWEMWKSAAAEVEVKSEVSEGFRTSLVERCVWALDLPLRSC